MPRPRCEEGSSIAVPYKDTIMQGLSYARKNLPVVSKSVKGGLHQGSTIEHGRIRLRPPQSVSGGKLKPACSKQLTAGLWHASRKLVCGAQVVSGVEAIGEPG